MKIPRIQEDKLKHIFVTFVMTGVICFIFHAVGNTTATATAAGIVAGMALGIGKEYGDKTAAGNRWDWYDILADFVGAILGAFGHYITHTLAHYL